MEEERLEYLALLYGATEEQLHAIFRDNLLAVRSDNFKQIRPLTDLEFQYVSEFMVAYKKGSMHLAWTSRLLEQPDLDRPKKQYIAESTLLLVGFFNTRRRTGRNDYPVNYYAAIASRFYQDVFRETGMVVYKRMSDHFESWLLTLRWLHKRLLDQSLESYLVKVQKE